MFLYYPLTLVSPFVIFAPSPLFHTLQANVLLPLYRSSILITLKRIIWMIEKEE